MMFGAMVAAPEVGSAHSDRKSWHHLYSAYRITPNAKPQIKKYDLSIVYKLAFIFNGTHIEKWYPWILSSKNNDHVLS
jgi:hypothetical protein